MFACQMFVVLRVHPVIISEPIIIGFSPEPYASNDILCVVFPELGGSSISLHNSPLLNRIWSPGLNDSEFTLLIVCQAVPSLVPALESFPEVAST